MKQYSWLLTTTFLAVLAVGGCGEPLGDLAEPGPAEPVGATTQGVVTNDFVPYPWGSGGSSLVTQGNGGAYVSGGVCVSGGDHTGLGQYAWDFALNTGTPVLAAKGGVVSDLTKDFGAADACHNGCGSCCPYVCGTSINCTDSGNRVVINHDDGTTQALYLHLDSVGVVAGQRVTAGQQLGLSGTSGWSEGPHLHFMVSNRGTSYYTQSIPSSFNNVVPACGNVVTSSNSGVDLAAVAVTKSVTNVNAGSTVTFYSGVKNNGGAASPVFNVRWYLDGAQVLASGHNSVGAGVTDTTSPGSTFTWTGIAGTHTIRFEVDGENAVSETNESNNSQSITFTVYQPGQFTNLSASLGCTATFNFSYSGTSPGFHVDLGLAPDLVNGTYLDFGAGSSTPISVSNAATKWASYKYGTQMWFRVTNHDGSVKSMIYSAGMVTCGAPSSGTFSNLSASLGCNATFNFSYSGTSTSYVVDLGLAADMVNGTYLNFGSGGGSPITVLNAPTKWASYTSGTPMWFRVKASDGTVSPITPAGNVSCSTSTGFTSASAALSCTASFSFAYSGSSPSFTVDLSLTSNFSSGVYQNFGGGSTSPITVPSAGTKWWNSYTYGRVLYYRIYNSDKSRSISGQATVSCLSETAGSFTSKSATLGCTPTFSFTYSGYTPVYRVDLSLTSNFSSGVYLDFGTGNYSPISVSNPKTKWSSYTHGRTLYYRIWNYSKTVVSTSGVATVNCVGL